MFCVALTGAIASGKSTVCQLFSDLGIDIINADQIAKQLTQKGEAAHQAIIEHFGRNMMLPDGNIDRSHLRTIITTDPHAKHWLEQLLHPAIRSAIKESIHQCHSPYCIVEIPLLVSKQDYPYINRVLHVDAPTEQKIVRLMQRDHASREQALAMLSIQPDEKKRRSIADDYFCNDGNMEHLKQHVNQLHQKYLQCTR